MPDAAEVSPLRGRRLPVRYFVKIPLPPAITVMFGTLGDRIGCIDTCGGFQTAH